MKTWKINSLDQDRDALVYVYSGGLMDDRWFVGLTIVDPLTPRLTSSPYDSEYDATSAARALAAYVAGEHGTVSGDDDSEPDPDQYYKESLENSHG